MQNLFHDGGFSNMGMSLKAMKMYNKSLDQAIADGEFSYDED
jgi:enoyl-[acyl-carrier protein] reductase I